MTRDEHRERVLGEVRGQGRFIRPGGDWAPVMLFDHEDDGSRQVVQIEPALIGSERGQVYLASGLLAAIRIHGMVRWATVGTSWVAKRDVSEIDAVRRGDAAGDPNRKEAVVVVLGSSDAPRDVEVHTAPIYRPARRSPSLGPWERGTAVNGLLVDPFVLAQEEAARLAG